MFTRFLSSAAIGIAVTTGLLFLMQFLIATGEEIIIEPREGYTLEWIALETEEQLLIDPPVWNRPPPAPLPPDNKLHGPVDNIGIGFNPPGPPPPTPASDQRLKRFNVGDGPLISIIKVKPQYPTIAAARGLEGTVLVQYDVSAIGTVENVVVIESSNSMFNKAAIAAAYRFKYKPKMVDGVPFATKGLRNLFRFEIEK